jgi:hypothetical protein
MTLGKIKKKNTIRVSQKDLLELLSHNQHLQNQVIELQTRGTELVTENRSFKETIEKLELQINILKAVTAPPQYHNPYEFMDPDIYFDGANH